MSPRKGILVLEDGSVFEGESFGAEGTALGEAVFNTSMTGYQEMLTDPSYGGQIVIPTYPLIGNYGINAEDVESKRIQVRGFVVREQCAQPSHGQSRSTLAEYLKSQGIPGLCEVDTRAITRRLRTSGVMMSMLTDELPPGEALERLRHAPQYGETNYVKAVSTIAPYEWGSSNHPNLGPAWCRIVVLDMGVKFNILRLLTQRGCEVIAVPCSLSASDILTLRPDGVVLSPGPGDPALLEDIVGHVRDLASAKPTLGICLGHQVLAQAFGGKTFKLKFGHRGANHPVRELGSGKVYITAQNHGYAVDPDSLPSELTVSHINLNDGTVEGMVHRDLPILSIQYHSEASPGPRDNVYIFDRFLGLVRTQK